MQPEGEPEKCLRDQILAAQEGLLAEYGKAATIFIIARVGTGQKAMEFIKSLNSDDEVGDFILGTHKRLEYVIQSLAEECPEDTYGYQKYVS